MTHKYIFKMVGDGPELPFVRSFLDPERLAYYYDCDRQGRFRSKGEAVRALDELLNLMTQRCRQGLASVEPLAMKTVISAYRLLIWVSLDDVDDGR